MGEKPKTGVFSLSVNSCPKPNTISKLMMMIAKVAKIQPGHPKYFAKSIIRLVEMTFPIAGRKTRFWISKDVQTCMYPYETTIISMLSSSLH